MTYVRKISGSNTSSSRRTSPQRGIAKIVPWVAIPGIGVAFAFWSLAIVGDLYSANQPTDSKQGFKPIAMASLGPASGNVLPPVSYDEALSRDEAAKHVIAPRSLPAKAIHAAAKPRVTIARSDVQKRFDQMAANAALTPAKLALLFGQETTLALADEDEAAKPLANKPVVGAKQARKATVAALAPGSARFGVQARDPALSRFGNATAEQAAAATVLAYAEPSPGRASDALSTLLTDPSDDDSQQESALPDYETTPDNIPLPRARPMPDKNKASKLTSAPQDMQDDGENDSKPVSKPASEIERRQPPAVQAKRATQRMASANPSDTGKSSGGLGQAFRNLFGGSSAGGGSRRAGNGVAVYDISAAKVYMPDGSVLEAHSGIGQMADNPRYVDKRMNGPTPPHTYNLKMRESRFHGVEAIRMLPVDGKNKYGRTGLLTHSYLLRNRRAQSHGCVAFANYDKFLKAFKQGKIRQLMVVPGGGRAAATRVASN